MTAYQRMYYYLDHAIGEALRTAVTPPQERLSGHRRRPNRKRQKARLCCTGAFTYGC